MKEFGQFGEIPPLFWSGQSCRKHALPHARKEAIQRWHVLTHNAYIITQFAYLQVPKDSHVAHLSRTEDCPSAWLSKSDHPRQLSRGIPPLSNQSHLLPGRGAFRLFRATAARSA